jgi:hypothetical protein
MSLFVWWCKIRRGFWNYVLYVNHGHPYSDVIELARVLRLRSLFPPVAGKLYYYGPYHLTTLVGAFNNHVFFLEMYWAILIIIVTITVMVKGRFKKLPLFNFIIKFIIVGLIIEIARFWMLLIYILATQFIYIERHVYIGINNSCMHLLCFT